MKVLCPECNHSVVVNEGEKLLRCPNCDLEANLSQIGTSPGVAATAITRDMSGEHLAGYQLIEVIGMGGMGIVYRGKGVDDREVALKILSCESAWKQDAFVSRFHREIKVLKRLDHPNIVQILDSGEVEGIHYLVTEFVSGENLAERLKKGPLGSVEATDILLAVLDAIAYAHKIGVVHRDIKPANILLASDGGVKVLDFGLAQLSGGETVLSTLTRTNLAMGTFNYLSPEQRTNAKSVDERADLFSLGVVLFEMLTGTLPLGNFRPPSRMTTGIDRRFDKVVVRSLASNPDDRYQSAERFASELEKIHRTRSVPLKAIAALVVAAVGLIFVMVWAYMPSSPEEIAEQADLEQLSPSKVGGKGVTNQSVEADAPPQAVVPPATPVDALPQQQAQQQNKASSLSQMPIEPKAKSATKGGARMPVGPRGETAQNETLDDDEKETKKRSVKKSSKKVLMKKSAKSQKAASKSKVKSSGNKAKSYDLLKLDSVVSKKDKSK